LDNLEDWITGDHSKKTQLQEVIEAGLITGALEQRQFASEVANDFGEMGKSSASDDRLKELLEASSEVDISSINKNQSRTNNRDIQAEIRESVLKNIEESKTAREASNYKEFAEFENGFKVESKAKFVDNLEEHISKIDPTVPRRRGIGGAHNKVEFEKNTVNIVNRVEHPKMRGVEKVTYQIPSVDGQTGEITGWKAKTMDKTIYDPDIIPTEKYMNLGKEAANDAASKGQLGREWTGYTDENGNVTSFFPEF
jgi:hypothetical protein